MLRFILFLSSIFCLYQTSAAQVVRIADGDCAAFQKAASQATGKVTTILLARNGHYASGDAPNGCNLNLLQGNLTIEGSGATMMVGAGIGGSSLFSVATGALLSVRNLNVTDLLPSPEAISPRISNAGELSFQNVTFLGNGFTKTFHGNPGSAATFRNTTWINGNLEGSFEAYNSTFLNSTMRPGQAGSMVFSNSLFSYLGALWSGQAAQLCFMQDGGKVTSLGGNVATDASCGFSSASGDKIAPNLSLSAAYADGLVPTVAIAYGNPAYRAGVAQYCEATDARGVVRNAANCDAGAYESGGGLGLVTENGMNGLYYMPGIANGHYVSVQRIHDNKDVLVFWNTFDSNGKQAWIYGVGTLTADRHIHAQMARNLGGVLQPGGPATGATASQWGMVDIDLTSCSAAQFNYQSDLPEFGSGQFPLTRLAFESAVNCGD